MKDLLWTALGVAVSVFVWFGIALVAGEIEAWDSALYFVVGVPVLVFASGAMGWARPQAPWRWGLAVSTPHVGLVAVSSASAGGANLLAIGVALSVVLVWFPCVASAYGGALLRRRRR